MLLAAAWAFFPLPRPVPHPPLALSPAGSPEEPARPLRQDVFAAKLWNPPATPQPVEVLSSSATPLNIELLAIIRQTRPDGTQLYVAAVYDTASDSVLMLEPGQRLGPRTVHAITPTTLELSEGSGIRKIELVQPPTAEAPV